MHTGFPATMATIFTRAITASLLSSGKNPYRVYGHTHCGTTTYRLRLPSGAGDPKTTHPPFISLSNIINTISKVLVIVALASRGWCPGGSF